MPFEPVTSISNPSRANGSRIARMVACCVTFGLALGCSSSSGGGAGTGQASGGGPGIGTGTGGGGGLVTATGGASPATGGTPAETGTGGAAENDAGASSSTADASSGAASGGAGQGRDAAAGATSPGGGSGGAGGRVASGGGGSVAHTGTWRIMPLGDSITGSTCVPQLLSKELKDNGRSNFVFVGGNLNNQSCGGAPNVMTEGHGGYLVTDLVGTGMHAAELPLWCAADRADIVLMHFGTNDAWNSRSTQSILAAYSTVLTDLRAINPNVIVFVAQIIPLNPAGCANCEAMVETLNTQIVGWASTMGTAASPIYVVDAHSAFTAATYLPNSMYTADGVHPNPAGAQLIADKWYAALMAKGLP